MALKGSSSDAVSFDGQVFVCNCDAIFGVQSRIDMDDVATGRRRYRRCNGGVVAAAGAYRAGGLRIGCQGEKHKSG